MKVTNSLTNNLPRLLLLGTVLANIAISFAQVPGTKLWEFATGAEVESSPAIGADGTVYVGSWDNGVYALDGATGAKRWEFAAGWMVVPPRRLGRTGRCMSVRGTTGFMRWMGRRGRSAGSLPQVPG
jgi:hypothetical protein